MHPTPVILFVGLFGLSDAATAVCEAGFTQEQLQGVYYRRLESGEVDPNYAIVVDPTLHDKNPDFPCVSGGDYNTCEVQGVDHWGYFMYELDPGYPSQGLYNEGYGLAKGEAFVSLSGNYFWCPKSENGQIVLTTNYQLNDCDGKAIASDLRYEFVKQVVDDLTHEMHIERKSCMWEPHAPVPTTDADGVCTLGDKLKNDPGTGGPFPPRCTPLLSLYCWNSVGARDAVTLEACANSLEQALRACMETGEDCVYSLQNTGMSCAESLDATGYPNDCWWTSEGLECEKDVELCLWNGINENPHSWVSWVPLDVTRDFSPCRDVNTTDLKQFRKCAQCIAAETSISSCISTTAPTSTTVTPTAAPSAAPSSDFSFTDAAAFSGPTTGVAVLSAAGFFFTLW